MAGSSVKLSSRRTVELETEIDKLESKLPAQRKFILPGGTLTATGLIYARALVRRAEREVVTIKHKTLNIKHILVYLNRLSDYLFILARWENFVEKVKEIEWKR